MFIPFKDTNPLTVIKFAWVNWALIMLNVLVFTFIQGAITTIPNLPKVAAAIATVYGVIPAELFGINPQAPAGMPEQITLITYMFLHGGWLHLSINMLFLWVFGDNIEDAMGHMRYLVFYLACGIAAALTHALFLPSSAASLIGASGAVAGVMGAYFMLHPKVRVWVLLFWRLPLPMPAILAIGIWIGFQIFNLLMSPERNVSWWAHIGGFAAGCVLIVVLRRKSFPLFDMR